MSSNLEAAFSSGCVITVTSTGELEVVMERDRGVSVPPVAVWDFAMELSA